MSVYNRGGSRVSAFVDENTAGTAFAGAGAGGAQVMKTRRTALGNISNAHGSSRPAGKPGAKGLQAGEDRRLTRSQRKAAEEPHALDAAAVAPEAVVVNADDEDLTMIPIPSPSKSPAITNFVRMEEPVISSVDAGSLDQPQLVAEYAQDIVNVWLSKEPRYMPAAGYMATTQTDINYKMRGILLDWLIEVHLKFKLVPETMYLSVNFIDRFLAIKEVARGKLQLVGITAMLIACKYQEIYPPEVNDFIFISDNAYTKDQILRMEECILNSLEFKVTTPTGLMFAQRWWRVVGHSDNKEFTQLVQYMMELSLIGYGMLEHKPSKIAAAAVSLALEVLKLQAKTPLQPHTGYSGDDLVGCKTEIISLAKSANEGRLTAVNRKFAHHKFQRVAKTADTYFASVQSLEN